MPFTTCKSIIATVGGIVGREENWSLMRQIGPIVYLRASWETLLKRIGNFTARPHAQFEEGCQRVKKTLGKPVSSIRTCEFYCRYG